MTTDERLDAIERELGRTKRVNRVLLAMVGIIVVASITGPTVTGQEGAAVVRACAFVVEGEDGAARAILGLDRYGLALTLTDARNKPRALISLVVDGTPSLVLSDEQGRTGLRLGMKSDGSSLSISDPNGTPRVTVSLLTRDRC